MPVRLLPRLFKPGSRAARRGPIVLACVLGLTGAGVFAAPAALAGQVGLNGLLGIRCTAGGTVTFSPALDTGPKTSTWTSDITLSDCRGLGSLLVYPIALNGSGTATSADVDDTYDVTGSDTTTWSDGYGASTATVTDNPGVAKTGGSGTARLGGTIIAGRCTGRTVYRDFKDTDTTGASESSENVTGFFYVNCLAL